MSRSLAAWLVVLLWLGVSGCLTMKTWRTQPPPWTQEQLEGAGQVRVTRTDGSAITMRRAKIKTEDGQQYVAGPPADPSTSPESQFKVPLADVTRLEIRKTSAVRVLLNAGIWIGSAAVLLAFYGLMSAISMM